MWMRRFCAKSTQSHKRERERERERERSQPAGDPWCHRRDDPRWKTRRTGHPSLGALTKKTPKQATPIDLSEVITEAVTLVQRDVLNYSVELRQVIINLMVNGMQADGIGG
jgi:hypothetical protein